MTNELHEALERFNSLPDDAILPSLALFRPHEQHSIKDGRNHMIGYGWEFLTEPGGRILRYGKEGVNFGVSAFLRHYPEQDVTLAILGVGEDAVWEPAARLDVDVLGQ